MLKTVKEFAVRWILPITLAVGLLIGILVGAALARKACGCDCGCCDGDGCQVFCGAVDATYDIDGQPITMKNGRHTLRIGDSGVQAVMTEICYLPVCGKLDGIQSQAAAVLLSRQAGGGDMVYYVAAAYIADGRVIGSNAVTLARNADITGVEIEDGMIWVSLRPCGGETVSLSQFAWKDGQLIRVG